MSAARAVSTLCRDIGIELLDDWLVYFELAKTWGARTALISARADRELAEILFLDAAHLIRAAWSRASASIVDVGAGVGAPTIPLLLSDETLRGTLVEPRRIRTAFLRTALGTLGLAERAKALEERLDGEAPSVEGMPFTVALSRATFPPERWLCIGARLAEEVWVLTAGAEPDPPDELRLVRRLDYRVPSSGAPRTILAYRSRAAVSGGVVPG